MIDKELLNDYENMPFLRYDELSENGISTVKYSELPDFTCDGVLKACIRTENGLEQLYTPAGNHVGVIAATRLGKTTGYVIPTILSFAAQKVKKSLIISDPKGEVYKTTAETLRRSGYKVRLINFRDRRHSECWNPITHIYRLYMSSRTVEDRVQVETEDGKKVIRFMGKIYRDQPSLDYAIETERNEMLADVRNEIDAISIMLINEGYNDNDRTWQDGARDLLKAFLLAMLEDVDDEHNPIKEETYSIRTIFEILSRFSMTRAGGDSLDDRGYFSDRSDSSEAKKLAAPIILWTRRGTASSYLSLFNVALQPYMDSTAKSMTCCNSFELDELCSDEPVALYICFRDELKSHYKIISMFVQSAYKRLIEKANSNADGKLKKPCYFVLDEFGNFPALNDFETTISACAGRNIWFILIIQSYAQLEQVYKKDVAMIIKDNLNVHIFFGSNNPETLEEFSRECGKKTIISPMCALSGNAPYIDRFEKDVIPLIPVSKLVRFEEGECIVTEANCGYVMLSKLERFYRCDEFNNLPVSYMNEYEVDINPFDKKYEYTFKGRGY